MIGFDTHDQLLKTNHLYQEIYQIQTEDGGDFDDPISKANCKVSPNGGRLEGAPKKGGQV